MKKKRSSLLQGLCVCLYRGKLASLALPISMMVQGKISYNLLYLKNKEKALHAEESCLFFESALVPYSSRSVEPNFPTAENAIHLPHGLIHTSLTEL